MYKSEDSQYLFLLSSILTFYTNCNGNIYILNLNIITLTQYIKSITVIGVIFTSCLFLWNYLQYSIDNCGSLKAHNVNENFKVAFDKMKIWIPKFIYKHLRASFYSNKAFSTCTTSIIVLNCVKKKYEDEEISSSVSLKE